MKTINKTRLRSVALAVLALLFLPLPSSGQELIRECNVKGDPAIVRALASDTWMVYYEEEFGGEFAKVTASGSTASNMLLGGVIAHVNDFEIVGDTLYFCGTSWNNTAVMGYFRLTGFPASQVYSCTVPLMATCRKLDVGHFNGTRHVVMVGDAILGTSHIVDARDLGLNQWNFNISRYTDINDIYDDVAITNSYVAVSARDTADKKAHLYYFNTPANGTSLLPQYGVPYLKPPHSSKVTVLLDCCGGDTICYLTRSTSNRFFIGVYKLQTASVPEYLREAAYTTASLLADIRYNPTVRCVAPLVYDLTNGYSSTYHFGFWGTLGATGHRFAGHKIMSLDALGNGRFIAAGMDANGYLCLYRHAYNVWASCADNASIVASSDFKASAKSTHDFTSRDYQVTAQSTYCIYGEINVTTICTQ